MSSKNQNTFKVRIGYVSVDSESKLGVDIELDETINLRGYQNYGTRITTKSRRTVWRVSDDITIREILNLCIGESIFNDDYGPRGV